MSGDDEVPKDLSAATLMNRFIAIDFRNKSQKKHCLNLNRLISPLREEKSLSQRADFCVLCEMTLRKLLPIDFDLRFIYNLY